MFFKRKKRFPTLAVLLLVISVIWFFSEMGYVNINVPWLPLTLIIAAIGWIFNRLAE